MRLAAYVLQVMGALGDRTRRVPPHDVARGIVPQAVYDRIGSWLQTRRLTITAVMARLQAGKVYRPRAYAPRVVAEGVARPVPPAPAAADAHLFRGFGWIYWWAPEVRIGAGHLVVLLDDPEMKAAVLAAPGPMVRAWAPLLNALGRRRPDWFPVLAKRVRVRRRRTPNSVEITNSLPPVSGFDPGSGEGDCYKPGADGYHMATTAPGASTPPPGEAEPETPRPALSPRPPMAVWTGRGPGPCRTLAEYRSPFEPPLWEVRVPKKS
jgi:hypothetical protein